VARVIRNGDARVAPRAIVDAREEAERILADAHDRANRLRDEQLAELRAEAREEARIELAEAHLGLERARQGVLRDAEASVVDLALAVAKRVIGQELSTHPDRVRALVREALDRVRRATHVRVRVHPEDAAELAVEGIEVVADASIERGGCIVQSDLGDVDARLDVRLDALRRALRHSVR
jgi:flagellar biosynthesis/type III secretory pathway protein FliH